MRERLGGRKLMPLAKQQDKIQALQLRMQDLQERGYEIVQCDVSVEIYYSVSHRILFVLFRRVCSMRTIMFSDNGLEQHNHTSEAADT